MTGLGFDERLEANAIIGRFLENETETFSEEDAERLIALIPRERPSLWRALFGKGSADEEDEDDNRDERDGKGHLLWTVGRYRVSHIRGTVGINLSKPDYDPPVALECVLKYDRKGHPFGLFRTHRSLFALFFPQTKRSSGSHVHLWKKPDKKTV